MNILFFSPNAFIDVHSVPEALIAKALTNRGHQILHVNCDGILGNYCISMSAAGLSHTDSLEKKNNICSICKNKRNEINKIFNFKNTFIDKFISNIDIKKIDEICEEINRDNWCEYKYEELDIGKYSAYELVLNEKINTRDFTLRQWEKYKIDFRNALLVLFSIKKIFTEFKPDRVIMYNNLYSANSVVCAYAAKLGVQFYSLHAGSHHVHMRSQMTIFQGRGSRRLVPYSKAWEILKNLPIKKEEVEIVNLHLQELLRATSPWVYSTQSTNKNTQDLKDFFNVNDYQKVALVTMSSEDEKFAGSLVDVPHQRGNPIFPSYLEWISYLVEWAKLRPDVKLIIRVHPREFPNKREAVLSKQAKILEKYLVNLPENVIVNWPADNVSLYDLFKIVDVGLNSSSTAGLEMVLFGMPVVILDENQLIPYPRDLNIFATNKEEYLIKINSAINTRWSIERVILAYRWLAFIYKVECIDISDGYFPIKKGIWGWALRRFFNKSIKNDMLSTTYEFNTSSLKNEEWLAYAIEKGTVSHMDRYAKFILKHPVGSAKEEALCVSKNINNIFKKMSKDDLKFQKKIEHMSLCNK